MSCRKCIRSREIHNPLDDHLRGEAQKLAEEAAERFKKLYALAISELPCIGDGGASSSTATAPWWVQQSLAGDGEAKAHGEAFAIALLDLAHELQVVPAARLFHHGAAAEDYLGQAHRHILELLLGAHVERELQEELEGLLACLVALPFFCCSSCWC